MIWNPLDTGDPWNGDWTGNIGTPSGARYAVGAGWRREYSGGTVLLNSSRSASQTFALGGSYLLPNGSSTSSVTLAPMTAMELRLSTSAPRPRPARRSTRRRPPCLGQPRSAGRCRSPRARGRPRLRATSTPGTGVAPTGTNCLLSPTSTSSSSYLLTAGDLGSTIVAQVAADGIWTTSANSAPSACRRHGARPRAAPAPAPSAPVNTAPPQVSGPTLVGKTLTASAGTWTREPELGHLPVAAVLLVRLRLDRRCDGLDDDAREGRPRRHDPGDRDRGERGRFDDGGLAGGRAGSQLREEGVGRREPQPARSPAPLRAPPPSGARPFSPPDAHALHAQAKERGRLRPRSSLSFG